MLKRIGDLTLLVLAGVVLAVMVGLVVKVATGDSILATLALVACLALVAWAVVRLVRSPISDTVERWRDMPDDDQVKAVYRHVARRWQGLAEDAGLGVHERTGRTDKRGREITRLRTPEVKSWEAIPQGVQAEIYPIPGHQSVEDVAKAIPRIASGFGDEVRSEVLGKSVRIIWRLRDPLAGVRHVSRPASRELAPLVIGRCEDGSDATLDIRDASHVCVQGQTRSGKSVFTYGVTGQLAQMDAVRLMGVDPNRVLLGVHAETGRTLPGDVALGADPDEAVAVLERAVAIMDERNAKLLPQRIDKLEKFTADEPIILLVLEEFAGLVRSAELADKGRKPADKVGWKINALVGRLVSEGAKSGIRVMLILQRADSGIIDTGNRAQFGTRVTFGVDNADAVRMLHPSVRPELVEEIMDFTAGRCYFQQRGKKQMVMQADLTDYDEYWERLEAVQNANA